jgi:hypothetical protein
MVDKLDECHGDGGDRQHNSVQVEAGPRKKHMYFPVNLQYNETRSETLAPEDPA